MVTDWTWAEQLVYWLYKDRKDGILTGHGQRALGGILSGQGQERCIDMKWAGKVGFW